MVMTPNLRERMGRVPEGDRGCDDELLRAALELRDALDRLAFQPGGGARNRGLSTALDLRDPAVKSGNQF